MHAIPGIVHGLQDPLGAILQLLTGVLSHVISTARGDLNHELTRYLYVTIDPSTAATRPFTANPTVAHLNASIAIAADVLVGAVVLFASLRSMFEHVSYRPRYTLKVVLPRLLVAIALVHLVLTYVVRTALLEILVVLAPLAALCTVLPDTRGYARMWLRLFMVTVFMQAVQLIVLRVATSTGFGAGDGLAGSLYALASLWIMLKVPGAMHTATQFESRAHSMGRHVERSMRRALVPVHHAVRHRTVA